MQLSARAIAGPAAIPQCGTSANHVL